jgi:hypothetical protein
MSQYPYLKEGFIIREGNFITVAYGNVYYDNIAKMFFEHFDNYSMNDAIIIIGDSADKNIHKRLPKKHLSKKIIFYQVEPLFSYTDLHHNQGFVGTCEIIDFFEDVGKIFPRSQFEIWEMEWMNKDYIEQRSDITVDRVVPARYTKSLKNEKVPLEEKSIDVLQFHSPTARRLQAAMDLAIGSRYYSKWNWVSVYSCVDHDYLNVLISHAKVVVNHHHSDVEFQEQFRILPCVMNDACVISEKSRMNYFKDSIIEVPLESMPSTIEKAVDTGLWMEYSNSSQRYKKVCEEFNFAV